MSFQDEAYVQAMDEIKKERLDEATWARAYSDSEGSNARAKSLYVQYRANKLIGAWLHDKKEEKVAERRREELERAEDEERIAREKDERARVCAENQKIIEEAESRKRFWYFCFSVGVGLSAFYIHFSMLSIWLLPLSVFFGFCWGCIPGWWLLGKGNDRVEGVFFCGGIALFELFLIWIF